MKEFNLSEKITNLGEYDGLQTEDVKEKIQNAKKKLKIEMELTIDNNNVINKVFLEEFGEKFI